MVRLALAFLAGATVGALTVVALTFGSLAAPPAPAPEATPEPAPIFVPLVRLDLEPRNGTTFSFGVDLYAAIAGHHFDLDAPNATIRKLQPQSWPEARGAFYVVGERFENASGEIARNETRTYPRWGAADP